MPCLRVDGLRHLHVPAHPDAPRPIDVERSQTLHRLGDVPLTPKGIDEARDGGRAIAHLPIDEVRLHPHPSPNDGDDRPLRAAAKTPVFQYPTEVEGDVGERNPHARMGPNPWRTRPGQPAARSRHGTNERMYGDLQGLNKGAPVRSTGPSKSTSGDAPTAYHHRTVSPLS